MTNNKKLLGTFTLTMISLSAIISLRNFPWMATQGYASISYYLFAALLFFIPTALVTAELGSSWPGRGGIYHWVTQAFGSKAGGVAVWLEWAEGIVWLPPTLSFLAAILAYVVTPLLPESLSHLADNRLYLVSTMLSMLWITTLLNALGVQVSSVISSLGVLIGSIIPGLLIISLGVYWISAGHTLQLDFSPAAIFPAASFDSLVFLTGVLLSFAGIEIAAYYIPDTQNPQKTFPKATFISAGLIFVLYVLGALSIAVVIPQNDINLVAGVMQAFSAFFTKLGIAHLTPVVAGFILIGGIALLNTWILGPSKGLLVSAEAGNLPKLFKKVNRFGAPMPILITQAILGSLFALVFLFMPSINSSYWILNVLTAQLILLMYVALFLSGIKLRFSQPKTPRPYRVPGGTVGMVIISSIGIIAALLTFVIGFMPPAHLDMGDKNFYVTFLGASLVLFSLPPFLWYWWQKK